MAATMKCPVCSNKLRRAKSTNVVVDVCTKCSGIWFDSGELQVFLKELVDKGKVTANKTKLFQPKDIVTEDQSKKNIRLCPQCSIVMKTFNYAYDSNVFVDKCPECEGIWTDKGEAKQLASYLKEDPREVMIAQDMIQRKKSVEELHDWADMGEKLSSRTGIAAWYMPQIILPLGDDNDRLKFPVVNLSIIVLCFAAFFYELTKLDDIQTFVNEFGFIPNRFWDISLITSMFLHGDIFHILGNMLFLWIFGDNVEDRFGHVGYVLFYLAAGIAASVIHAVFNMGVTIPAIGASGAISGVMGAYCVLFPNARLKMFIVCRVVPVPAFLYLTIWFGIQLFSGTLSLSRNTGAGIAWFAHIGGFAFGMLSAYSVKILSPKS